MCTVTYIPIQKGFILTSSRDEKLHRPTLKPKAYNHNETILVYPKDEIANGTWISASNKNRVACLLNGAFENHEKNTYYSKSRGQVLIDCFRFNSFKDALEHLDLKDIEPFTLLLIDYNNEILFYELKWDGEIKHIQLISNHFPHIWSSATLYTQEDRQLRKNWFDKWLKMHNTSIDLNILNFHTTKHSIIESNDIIMKRKNDLQTISISQISITDKSESFLYYDLIDNSKTTLTLSDYLCTQE